MIGNVRHLNIRSVLAAAAAATANRLTAAVYRLRAWAQVRFNLMEPRTRVAGTSVIPTVRYRDVPAAIQWLRRAFGMKVHRVVTDGAGAPRYAEMTIGTGMLIVAPIEDTAFGKLMVQPDEIGGVETQVCYLCVGNARAHYARAKAAGAVIVIDPEDEVNRGRGYSCRDPEGHVWNFGTYDPWGKRTVEPPRARFRPSVVQHAAAAIVLLALGGLLAAQFLPQPSARAGTAITEPAPVALAVVEARGETSKAPDLPDPGAVPAAEGEAAQRAAVEAAERASAQARAQLAEARNALAMAEREATAVRSQLDEMQRAKLAAERAAAEARTHLASVQKTAERAREEAAEERSRRLAADRLAASRATTARAAAFRSRRGALARSAARSRPRTWCYNPYAPNPAAVSKAQLYGFCRG